MAGSININQNNNDITIQDQNGKLTIIDNNTGTTTNVTQPITNIVTVASLGPQGLQGIQGPQGPQGEAANTSSFVATSSFNSLTSSFNTLTSSFVALTSSFNTFTGSYNTGSFTGSFKGDGSQLTGIVSSKWSGSNPITRDGNVEITGSLKVTGGITADLYGTSSWASDSISASYATIANSVNTLNQNVLISGSFTVVGNSIFYGSSSFTYITASQLDVSASFISVNVFEPAQRFGGLIVYDSGSSLATASLAWDSLHNHWVYQNVSGATYTGGMFLSGPRNTGSLGDEPNLTKWFVPRGDGGDHLNDSQIFTSGSTTQITGSLTVTAGITGSLSGNASTAATASYALTASYLDNYIPPFPFTGSARITGSLTVTGSIYTNSIIYSPFIISINFETITSYTYKAPYAFKINSVESNPSSSITLSYVPSGSVSSSNYIFGATINKFDSLTVIPLTASLVILNSVRI